ncbi:PREDICTED: mitochondrial ribosome-associated GTPase 2-like [Priapulus caudatus]|uniref:Mitochondrial ribosome-associated GTPase 2-like n=1 Tax=Priapulus caudatus TaxID=37621 RepID=A0ABM1EYR9_PRICU|nr:PREDICTED: mitochondrial ribosome-associated GTPase 2-like [Priapulus caudatus]XP_014678014.1 PREDICTED: mitochondrial ribosome-associated GTPase 2-like [Priapulus caudatus]
MFLTEKVVGRHLVELIGRTTAQFRRESTAVKPKRWKKPRSSRDTARPFVDYRRVLMQAGDGGDGNISFLRVFCNAWAGPDGGDGGNGGHVIFKVDANMMSLEHLKPMYKAANGMKGSNKDCNGGNAEHLIIKVPMGTVFFDEGGSMVCDLKKKEDVFVATRGGAGGKGNHYFASNENRAPYIAEEGAIGEKKLLHVELRTIAHAGLVGFPNAGKSTLLRAISRARPRVAAYPFTTRNPHVGIIEYEDYEQISVADIPGLIRGAHKNRGLGYSFLKHIERCNCLVYVLDASASMPWTQLEDLQYELECYSPGLSHVPHAVIANKVDLGRGLANLPLLQEKIGIPVIPVSAKYKQNMEPLLEFLRREYDKVTLRERTNVGMFSTVSSSGDSKLK